MISLVFSSYPRSTIWLLLAASEAQAPAIKTSVERILNKAKVSFLSLK
jgi:hypothetical protein